MQGLLKDADARQDVSEAVRQWVADARELAYDAEDVIATYALKVGSRKGGGMQRLATILSEGIAAHNIGSEIESIKMKITNLKTNFRDNGIKESIIQGVVLNLKLSGVAERLGDSLIQEANFLCGVSTQVELLKTELKQMQGLLKDADARQDESEAVRQWVADARELAYDAEDVIATYALEVGSRKGGGMQRFATILSEGIAAHNIGSEIESIKMKFTNLKTNFRDYGIKESIIQGGGSNSLNERERERRKTFSHFEHDAVGFGNDLNKLVEFLQRDEEGNRVASICGMGGLGKTTLVKMIHNLHKIKQHFDCRTWSYISEQCQRRHV
ncbi:hypothetical protein ACB092_07G171800 [Castanea dentata]